MFTTGARLAVRESIRRLPREEFEAVVELLHDPDQSVGERFIGTLRAVGV